MALFTVPRTFSPGFFKFTELLKREMWSCSSGVSWSFVDGVSWTDGPDTLRNYKIAKLYIAFSKVSGPCPRAPLSTKPKNTL